MSQKSAALEAKFEIAVKTLMEAPNLTVLEAKLVAKLLLKDIENKNYAVNYVDETHSWPQESNGRVAPSRVAPSQHR